MADYFSEADEHGSRFDDVCWRSKARRGRRSVAGHRRALPERSLAEGHLGDGRAARGGGASLIRWRAAFARSARPRRTASSQASKRWSLLPGRSKVSSSLDGKDPHCRRRDREGLAQRRGPARTGVAHPGPASSPSVQPPGTRGWTVRSSRRPNLSYAASRWTPVRARLLQIGRISASRPTWKPAAASRSSSRCRPMTRPARGAARRWCLVRARQVPVERIRGGPRNGLAEPAAWEVAAGPPANFVRVDLARLDDLMRLVGDLVVARSRLEDTLRRVEASRPCARLAAARRRKPAASSGSCATCAKASCACDWFRWRRFSGACRSSCATWHATAESACSSSWSARAPRSTSS